MLDLHTGISRNKIQPVDGGHDGLYHLSNLES